MYLTGFADEAAPDVSGQIEATRALGWEHIEARSIEGVNIHDMDRAAFDEACAALEEAGMRVNCFGSTIANWGKSIEEDFEVTLAELRRAIPRMRRLGTGMIRIMSYAVRAGGPAVDQMAAERFRRLREIQRMLSDEGIVPVHENCMNYGGMGWSYTLELLENVPGLKLVFDTGNPVMTADYAKGAPYPRQSSWDFYEHVREHIAYVHVKDGRFIEEVPGEIFPKAEFTFPGDGDGDVRRILADLLARGYDGGISIEPHLKVVFHEGGGESSGRRARFDSYVAYGRRLEAMLEEIGPGHG